MSLNYRNIKLAGHDTELRLYPAMRRTIYVTSPLIPDSIPGFYNLDFPPLLFARVPYSIWPGFFMLSVAALHSNQGVNACFLPISGIHGFGACLGINAHFAFKMSMSELINLFWQTPFYLHESFAGWQKFVMWVKEGEYNPRYQFKSIAGFLRLVERYPNEGFYQQ
jgi:hypothetical protein